MKMLSKSMLVLNPKVASVKGKSTQCSEWLYSIIKSLVLMTDQFTAVVD